MEIFSICTDLSWHELKLHILTLVKLAHLRYPGVLKFMEKFNVFISEENEHTHTHTHIFMCTEVLVFHS